MESNNYWGLCKDYFKDPCLHPLRTLSTSLDCNCELVKETGKGSGSGCIHTGGLGRYPEWDGFKV